ncbi:MAG: hypothetical protein AAF664_07735 [Planctomycetota bacterium]
MNTIDPNTPSKPQAEANTSASVVADHWLELAGRFSDRSLESFGMEVDQWLEGLTASLERYESPKSRGENVARR